MAIAQPTQATQTNFGDIVQRGVAGVQRAQALEDQRREREQQRQLEFEDRYGIPEELFQLEDTEFRTVNDATTEALSIARDRYYDVYKALQKDPTNIDLKKRLGKIKNFVTTMGQSHQKMMDMGQNYLQKVQEGSISGVDEDNWREQLEAYDEGRVRVMMDADDNPQFVFYGKDGQIQNAVKYTELLRGNLLDKVDIRGEVSELVKGLGGYKQDTPDGMYIRTNESYGVPQRQAAAQWVDAQLEDDATMADMLNQVTGSKKREGFTAEEYQAVRDYLNAEIEGRYVQKETLKPDTAKTARFKAAESRGRQDLKQPQASDISISSRGDQPQINPDGTVSFSIAKAVGIDPNKKLSRQVGGIKQKPDGSIVLTALDQRKIKGVQGRGKEDEALEEAQKDKPELTLADIFMQEDENNQVTYYVREPVEIDSRTEPDAVNRFANIIGLTNERGLRDYLRQQFFSSYEGLAQDFYGQQSNTGEKPKAY